MTYDDFKGEYNARYIRPLYNSKLELRGYDSVILPSRNSQRRPGKRSGQRVL